MAQQHDNSGWMIDEDELSDLIAAKLGLDAETVASVLDGEMAFWESKGLVVEDNQPTKESAILAATPEIDTDELVQYVALLTKLDQKLVAKILVAETAYIESQA